MRGTEERRTWSNTGGTYILVDEATVCDRQFSIADLFSGSPENSIRNENDASNKTPQRKLEILMFLITFRS